MDIKDVLLGFLDWKQMTGYELKGLFAETDALHWSGNNNQIYKALLELEREGLAEKQVVQQENYPAQKRYSATDKGREQLKRAVQEMPEDTTVRNDFLLHLMWSQCLSHAELISLINAYQARVEQLLAMAQEKIRRGGQTPGRSEREEYIFGMILQNQADHWQHELNFLTRLRNGLKEEKR